ncbi:dehydrogenase [Virgibacillus profundi]|uniref:Dehydrogenase n=1 Tax=Virgibacillus profundi TaxID=2024555 RepID=A0A2A2IKK7_9BACI|nr:gluconate 2-dehydrogenase subunit 3 family protein [Virgibacillus profundi]PAV31665.1 dehydrogenase [Virgibacillus profundi]PXY55851.1 gluconate 2-dehydrogenase subunit 3 family protein [Virgibacillus profundi]
MSDKENPENKQDTKSTRRDFIKSSSLTVGGLVVGGAVGGLLGRTSTDPDEKTETKQTPAANPNEALMFFYPDEYQTTMAAAERIFPEDDLGPGARGLNVAIYIDHQLASQWGVNAKDYRMGPWYNPEPTQGGQVRLLRKDLFRLGIKQLDNYSKKKFDNTFVDLESDQQVEVLVAFENGEANALSGVPSSEFFKLLRTLTLEGVYADPMYGGNNEMEGWAMRKYPGTRMNYVKEVESKEFIKLEPKSLHSHMKHS